MGNRFCMTFQGSLKEKTVENLEKYVVKDVSKPNYSTASFRAYLISLCMFIHNEL